MRQRSARSGRPRLSTAPPVPPLVRSAHQDRTPAEPAHRERMRVQPGILEMKRRLRPAQHRRSGACVCDLRCQVESPAVIPVAPIAKGDEKAGIRNRFHLRENPLRAERSAGPSIFPASRINGRLDSFCARSNSRFTMRPRGIPDFRDDSSSHCARSSGSRIVSVVPIRSKCNTQWF